MPALRTPRAKHLLVVAALAATVSVVTGPTWQAGAAVDFTESTFVPIAQPERILDTRDPVDIGLAGPFTSQEPQTLRVTGAVPTATGTKVVVPAGVVLNVTAINSTSATVPPGARRTARDRRSGTRAGGEPRQDRCRRPVPHARAPAGTGRNSPPERRYGCPPVRSSVNTRSR